MIQLSKLTIRLLLVTLTALLVFQLPGVTLAPVELIPRMTGDQLLVSAPKLHFLLGRQLERLHNGGTVPFDFQLSVSDAKGNPALQRALERFVISYDLWEEKFKVVQLRNLQKAAAHMTAAATEAWCLENISLSRANLPTDRSVYIRLEVRTADAKPMGSQDSGISLSTLIDLFSRPSRGSQDSWTIESGPFKFADVRR